MVPLMALTHYQVTVGKFVDGKVVYTQETRTKGGPPDWHYIHDFMRGYGYKDVQSDRYVFWGDVYKYLGIDHIDPAKLEALYVQLQPHLEAAAEKRRQWMKDHPMKPFDRITVPKFTKNIDALRTWAMDIREVLTNNPLKDQLNDPS